MLLAAKRILTRRLASSMIVKFLLAGGCATVVQYSLLMVLVELFFWGAVLASIFAYAAGALVNYLLNYYFTFSSSANHVLALIKFSVVATIGLMANAGVMYLGVELLQLHYLLSQVAATLVVLVWNFLAHKFWTYRSAAT